MEAATETASAPSAAPTDSAFFSYLVLAVLSLTTLWDYYIPSLGIRPFDFIALGVLLVTTIVAAVAGRFEPVPRRDIGFCAAIVGLTAVYLMAAVFLDTQHNNGKACAGVCLGVPFFMVVRSVRVSSSAITRGVSLLILVHAACLLVQDVVYVRAGVLINFQSLFGLEPRALSGVFRPTGLFLEPAAFSYTMFMLISIRMRYKSRIDAPIIVGLLAIAATTSLWGVVIIPVLLSAHITRSRRSIATVALATLVVSGVAYYEYQENRYFEQSVEKVADRTERLSASRHADTSAESRYGELVDFVEDPSAWDANDVFGQGISSDYLRYGTSGYAFLLRMAGVAGGLTFLALFLALGQPGERLRFGYLLIVLLTAAPIWTYFLWWTWLAFMGRPIVVQEEPEGALQAA
jgi:hypothetical protein